MSIVQSKPFATKVFTVFLFLVLSVVLVPVQLVYANACTWTGSTSTDWNDASNWSGCGGVTPLATDTVTIPDVTNDPLLGSDVSIAGLTIDPNGILSLGTYILTLTDGGISNNGTLSGDSGTLLLAFSASRTLSGSGLYDLNHLTIDASGGTVNLSSNVTLHVGGDFAKLAGSFRCNSSNNATANTCTLDFDGGGTSSFSWTTSSILPWNITVQSGTTVNLGSTNSTFTLRGDLGGDGTLTASGGTIIFDTVTTAHLAGMKSLNNISVNSPTQLLFSTNASLAYAGTFTFGLGGTFDAVTNAPTTLTLSGTSLQVLPSGITALHNLTINNPSGASLGANITVNGTLALGNNTLTTNAYIVSLASATGITRGSGFVIGNLEKPVGVGNPSLVYEVGTGTTYAPISITFNNVTVSGTLTGSTTAERHPEFMTADIGDKYIRRYWSMTPSGLTFASYNATFTFVSGDLVGSPDTNLLLVRKYNAGWTSPPGGSSSTATSVTGSGFTSFSDFYAGNGGTPTPVTLSYFAAERRRGVVDFEWSTSTETGNVGFNLYAEGADGERSRLNEELLPSSVVDSLERRDYTYSARVQGNLFYVEDVAIDGATRLHGPFEAGEAYGDRLEADLIDWSAVKAKHDTAKNGRRANLVAARSLNLKVNRTGVYRVRYDQLRDAGLDLAGVPLEWIKLSNRGKVVPVFINGKGSFGPGKYIEFYGRALDTIYTDTNVYTLQVSRSGGDRIQVMSKAPVDEAQAPASYTETLVVNDQRMYANYAPGKDNWYDARMLVYVTARSWDFDFNVDGLADPNGSASLEVVAWGVTNWPESPDHHLQVSLNGMPLADEWFDGLVEQVIKIDLPAGLLQEGTNRLTLTLPGDTGVKYDLVNLDKFKVSYPRVFRAQNGQLTFRASGLVQRVTNLPGRRVVAYRLTKNGPVRIGKVAVEQAADGSYTASFAGAKWKSTYVVSVVGKSNKPVLEPVLPPASLDIPAQYLIVSHPDFIAGLAPLVQARQAQGLTVNVVDVNDLYNQYSYGIFSPQAIKRYIEYAARNLGTEYVLLVGGDTYDYRDYLGKGSISFIPSLYVDTGPIARFVPVDPLYTDLDGDRVPDLAIGRLPVRTVSELDMVVGKTLAYASKTYERTAVFASDRNDGIVSFKGISDRLAIGMPQGWAVESLHLDDLDVATAQSRLLAAMNRGTALVTFTGHSGPASWTFSNLFSTKHAVGLTNYGRPFVAVQWGCWNTYYVDPVNNYLVQSLLVSGDQGAAAVMGASTLTDSDSEHLLGELLMPELVQPGKTIGAALRDAKLALAQSRPDLLDVLLGWSLMGDPTLIVQP